MRVVDRKTFMKLPAGTAFQKGKPWVWGGLCFKSDQMDNDWLYQQTDGIDAKDSGEMFAGLDEMLATGASYPIETALIRDGCFDEDDLFLIYEVDDIDQIQKCLAVARDVAEWPALAAAMREVSDALVRGIPQDVVGHVVSQIMAAAKEGET